MLYALSSIDIEIYRGMVGLYGQENSNKNTAEKEQKIYACPLWTDE
jgi:hypothetical protein